MVDNEALKLERPIVWRDVALPSGNSVACYNLFRLGLLTGNASFREQAERLVSSGLRTAGAQPVSLCFLLGTAEMMQGKNLEIVLAGDAQHAEYSAMLEVLRRMYLPDMVIARSPESVVGIERLDFYQHVFSEKESEPKVFLCDEEKCLPPLSSGASLGEALKKRREGAR